MKKRDFGRLRQQGHKIFHPLFTLNYFYRDDNLPPDFGFIITNKIAPKAVVRNRTRRLFRESVHNYLSQMSNGYDVLFIIKDKAVGTEFATLKVQIESVLKQAGVLKNQ